MSSLSNLFKYQNLNTCLCPRVTNLHGHVIEFPAGSKSMSGDEEFADYSDELLGDDFEDDADG